MDYSGAKNGEDGKGSPPAEAYYLTRAALDAAKQKSIEEQGVEPRVLLLSHPQNPLGICYPPEVVKETIDWCRENEIHLISDVKEDDIEIKLEENLLTVQGQRTASSESSRFSSKFSKTFSLDQTVDVEKFTASLKNGVLTVSAPKDLEKLEENVR